ncbi:hypothetical protein [Nannocystis bainbridge]|uniref:Secreted protein n=1 Tax=Nannocystis bainbridge TaxID=2995303 RepID=A0ABT5DR73_9BACT|nr:hypothetical protein [Nannocystis bainbridge]MDC0715633.1 hypothetical protein [Nannocystis bainbridge]
MKIHSLCLSLAAATLVTAAPGFASEAAAADLTNRVPASACSPETPDDDASLQLSNGSWILSGTETGTMTLWCPVATDKPYTGFSPFEIDYLRLWYRDPDGTAAGSQVTAQLYYRTEGSNNIWPMTAGVNSNTSSVTTSNTLSSAVTTNTSTDALFFVKVTISRDSTSSNVAFHGFDLALATVG